MINYDQLMNFPIPDVHHTLTKQTCAFYALSCGLGADPMDERQLDYVDFDRALKVLPSMPVVMGYSSTPLPYEELGIDAVKIVHGEQAVEILAPLPAETKIIGRSRIAGVIDKGEGRGALMLMERDIIDAASGDILAKTLATVFLRANGGFGGPTGPVAPPPPIPDTPPDISIDLPTRPEQALYYRMNGDHNPLHADPGFAARAGFPRPILHGLCTFGVVTHALVQALCGHNPSRLQKFSCRFSAPVFPGETITTDIWKTGAFRARVASRDAVVVNHGVAVVGA